MAAPAGYSGCSKAEDQRHEREQMPRLRGSRASSPPRDAYGTSRCCIAKHRRRWRASPIRFLPTNRHSAPVSATGFSALCAANSWMPHSRLRTDRPTVAWATPRCLDDCRSWEAVQATVRRATQEKRRVANRRMNRGSEAHGRQAARQVVTSR
jgi:hypothetical protein